MDTRLGYIGGIVAFIIAFFPENNWIKAAFAGIGIFSLIIAFIFHDKTASKVKNKPVTAKQKSLKLTSNHISILKFFRANDGNFISAPDIENSTDIETIIINTILAELEKHIIIHATNYDDLAGGWQYQLSDKGRKLIIKIA